MNLTFNKDHWVAEGEGELRPILCEGITRESAKAGYVYIQCLQYEEAQKATNLSMTGGKL